LPYILAYLAQMMTKAEDALQDALQNLRTSDRRSGTANRVRNRCSGNHVEFAVTTASIGDGNGSQCMTGGDASTARSTGFQSPGQGT